MFLRSPRDPFTQALRVHHRSALHRRRAIGRATSNACRAANTRFVKPYTVFFAVLL
jgi:hypothetical protein